MSSTLFLVNLKHRTEYVTWCVMSEIQYQIYRNKHLDIAANIIIKNRLYTPKTGTIRNTVSNLLCDVIVIAYHDEQAVGCIIRDKYPISMLGKNGMLKHKAINTWIKPAYRRKGIGGCLIAKMKKHSRIPLIGYGSTDGSKFYKCTDIPVIEYR